MIAEKVQIKVKGMIHLPGVNDVEYESFMRGKLYNRASNYCKHDDPCKKGHIKLISNLNKKS